MKLKTILKERRGSVYTDTLVNFLIVAVLIVIGITAFGAMAQKFSLILAASDVKRIIEVDGKYDTAEQQKISDFLSAQNINAAVTVSPTKDTYNLGDTFTVTLNAKTSLGAGGLSSLTLPINGKASGSCEVYHK